MSTTPRVSLLPNRRRAPVSGVPVGVRVQLPHRREGEGVFVVMNPKSGVSVVRADPETVIRSRMPRARVHVLEEGEQLRDVIAGAAASGVIEVLGVCGGDGTVTAVAHLARQLDVPLLAVPGGTFNHFVRATGVESVDDAIDAFEAGRGVRVDVAELSIDDGEPVTVLNAASIGVYPAFVAEREALQSSLGKWIAGIVASRRVLRNAEPVDVRLGTRRARVWSLYVGVDGNVPETVAPMRRYRLHGGILDVRVLHARSRVHAVGSLAFGRLTSAVLRRLRLIPADTTAFTTESVDIAVRRSPGGAPLFAYDGEVFGDLEDTQGDYVAHVRIVPAALTVYAP
jgi:diacylglycerol kinase family enzyme